MKKIILCGRLTATLATVVAAGEFYRLDLAEFAPGTVLVRTDASGKPVTLRPTWGMWPRTPDKAGAKVVERDGVKALEIQPGFQINSAEWSMSDNDAQQSVVYCRFRFLLPELAGKGITGSLRLQQANNRTAAFIGFEPKGAAFDVLAGDGDGKGGIRWQKAGRVEPGAWFTVDVKLDFNKKTFDVSVDGRNWETNRNFRHAAQWVGTMWAENLKDRAYRYDIEAGAALPVLVSEAAFSSDPFPAVEARK